LSLTARDVAQILKALQDSSFDTLDLEVDGVKLRLRRDGAAPAAAATRASGAAPPVEVPPGTTPVPAPLLGIFYRAPKPGEPPFVEEGARVEADTIIGIIEVMKLMNTVRAGLRGTVVAIPARNGELVEFGEALLFVKPD
jgi:acetyl-CoA carboxylase biotin carboxyl carrier protein